MRVRHGTVGLGQEKIDWGKKGDCCSGLVTAHPQGSGRIENAVRRISGRSQKMWSIALGTANCSQARAQMLACSIYVVVRFSHYDIN